MMFYFLPALLRCCLGAAAAAILCCWSFTSLVDALNSMREDGSTDKDAPGRMLVLHHAWYMLNGHPNMTLKAHAANAVKLVS